MKRRKATETSPTRAVRAGNEGIWASDGMLLPAHPRSVAAARTLLCAISGQPEYSPTQRKAELLISELVGHAVGAGRGPIEVTVRVETTAVTIRVRFPSPEVARLEAQDVRAMAVVRALSDRWGHDAHESGSSIWCTVQLPARGRSR
jgi:hypothetical protein